jgi:anti-anti-sigma factor
MFGKFRRSGRPGERISPLRGATGSKHSFGFDQRGDDEKPQTRQSATYDRLGQTLVATPLVDTLTGPDAGALASELYEQIHAAVNDENAPAGIRHIVLDLQNVQYMDSMCVGVLVELLTTLKEAGGQIALVNPSNNIECLFKLTRLDRVFPICRDVMKAIDLVEREG